MNSSFIRLSGGVFMIQFRKVVWVSEIWLSSIWPYWESGSGDMLKRGRHYGGGWCIINMVVCGAIGVLTRLEDYMG